VVLVDTSLWIDVLRDATGARARSLRAALDGDEAVLSRFTELELLQGCADDRSWLSLREYLDSQTYLDMSAASWSAAARLYFDLRRRGRTVHSPVDCCIAQLAIDHQVLLLHRDEDFSAIAGVSGLVEQYLKW
jgi:predicted nucleic acid-binding protein